MFIPEPSYVFLQLAEGDAADDEVTRFAVAIVEVLLRLDGTRRSYLHVMSVISKTSHSCGLHGKPCRQL